MANMTARKPAAASATALVGARIAREHPSDDAPLAAPAVTQLVMAEHITHDVVNEAQPMGGASPIDGNATSTSTPAGDGDTKPTESTPAHEATADGDGLDESEASDKAAGDAVPEDAPSHHALGDASGGSDTDISRPGSVDQTKDRPEGHLRSNSVSVKKPASFKSVSVTKNFLAKSAVSTPSAAPGVKAAPPGQPGAMLQQTTKPRLVAKSGSGLVPRSSLSKSNGAGSGPDASKVWNKNQPVPPPPPKHFTDEELKQQYGIHLATRLQADDSSSKEAKWADIDEDEDDWAPDTVQWMDGTKSTVPVAVENLPPPPEEPKPAITLKKEPVPEAAKPLPAPVTISQRPSSTSGTKTILKPGAQAHVLKGQAEKPTLVAKPSASSVKSPWASLPPVEKVSPVQMNPAVPPPPRFAQRDSHGYDSMPPPAKEIAPDDFNRSWRDERGNNSRELFNSHSGRYEPVNEMRRGSVRDNSLRHQPSVLQRPSHDGPAEPSAAFQTARSSADVHATWGRRRNSSNVSGGSGRMPLPPMATNVQRRGSHSINGADALTPDTPRLAPAQTLAETQKPSPNLSNAQLCYPMGSVNSAVPQEGAPPTAPVEVSAPIPIETAVEMQQRLMREKRELARLHKLQDRENELKEEAERKERLRKKLEALAPKPKEPSPVQPVEKAAPKDKAAPAPMQSPPKPPVPTAEGEIAQYGMMKVHQPHPVKRAHEVAAPKSARAGELAPKASSPPVKGQGDVQPTTSAPLHALPEAPTQQSNALSADERDGRSASEQAQAHAQQSEGGDARTTAQAQGQGLKAPPVAWSATPLNTQPTRTWGSNVWGPPQAKERALGNGTFDSSYNRGQPRPGPSQLPSQPQPRQAPSLEVNPSSKLAQSQPQGAPKQAFATMPPHQPAVATRPEPIPASAHPSWGNFSQAIRQNDRASRDRALERSAAINSDYRPEIREVFTDRRGKVVKTVHEQINVLASGVQPEVAQPSAVELKAKDEMPKPNHINTAPGGDVSSAPTTFGQGAHLQPSGPGARSSRFFPKASDTTNLSSSAPNKPSFSPPPPETQSHPAFTGDSRRPVVRLPRAPPRVRLPPAATDSAIQPEAPVSMPSRAPVGLGARPFALDPEWQKRFNSLLEKPATGVSARARSSPPAQPGAHAGPGALAIAASSKAPLDVRSYAAATVSLPYTVSKRLFAEDGSSEITTRSSAEEILLEDREFGSLPVVKTPKVPHLAANEPSVGYPPARRDSRLHKPLEVTSIGPFNEIDRNAHFIDVKIRLPNMHEAMTKTMARKPENRKGSGHHKGPKRNNFPPNNGASNASTTGHMPRGRKPANYQGQGSNANHQSRPTGGNGWTSNRATLPNNNTTNSRAAPPNSNSAWTRRSAPVH